GLLLFCHVDNAHAAFPDLLEQLVRADDRAGTLCQRLIHGASSRFRRIENLVGFRMGAEQGFHPAAQLRIAGAGSGKVRRSFLSTDFLQRGSENAGFTHDSYPSRDGKKSVLYLSMRRFGRKRTTVNWIFGRRARPAARRGRRSTNGPPCSVR